MALPTEVTGQFYSAADDAIAGYGAELKIGDGASPENFEAIAAVTRIVPGAQSSTDVKTTHLRSINRHEEHRAGMRDTSVFTVEGTYLPSDKSHSTAGGGSGAFASGGLPYLSAQGDNHNFQIVCNDASTTTISFRGYVATFSIGEINKDGVIPFTATFQPTQAPVLP
jgi:hypothetical protein